MEARKRRRLQGACDRCRSRKVACDSAQRLGEKCSHCAESGVECTHYSANARKNGIPQHAFHYVLEEDIQVHVEAILSLDEPYVVPDNKTILKRLLTGLAHYARGLEANIATLERQLSVASSTPDNVAETMEESMAKLTLSASINYGASDEVYFPSAAIDIELSRRRLKPWTTPPLQHMLVSPPPIPLHFPPPDLLCSLVDIYLQTVNVHSCPLLHGPSFRRDISRGLHFASREFGSVVLAVCAVASHYSTDPRIRPGHKAGWQWFEQLHPVDMAKCSPGLWDLQLIVIMAIYAHWMAFLPQIWFLVGLGIRIAHDMRVHRKRRANDGEWTPYDELLKRAWWGLVFLDVYTATLVLLIHPLFRHDVDYPLEVDEDCWPGELLADPAHPWTQPSGVPSRMTAWTLHIKLLEILSFAQSTIYSVKRSKHWDTISTAGWGYNVAVELDSALNAWVDALPDHLRLGSEFPVGRFGMSVRKLLLGANPDPPPIHARWPLRFSIPFQTPVQCGDLHYGSTLLRPYLLGLPARDVEWDDAALEHVFGLAAFFYRYSAGSGRWHYSEPARLGGRAWDDEYSAGARGEMAGWRTGSVRGFFKTSQVPSSSDATSNGRNILREIVILLKVPQDIEGANPRKRTNREDASVNNVEFGGVDTFDWNAVLNWNGGDDNWDSSAYIGPFLDAAGDFTGGHSEFGGVGSDLTNGTVSSFP